MSQALYNSDARLVVIGLSDLHGQYNYAIFRKLSDYFSHMSFHWHPLYIPFRTVLFGYFQGVLGSNVRRLPDRPRERPGPRLRREALFDRPGVLNS